MTRRFALSLLLLACNGSTGDDDSASSSTSHGDTDEPVPYVPVDGDPFPWSAESRDAACADQADNDGNGYVDCDDFACSRNPSVTVCGALAVYEASPDLCADERDNDGDALVDCADPDCSKNPFHAVCDKPRSETDCTGARDGDGDGQLGCDDRDCAVDTDVCPPNAASLRVLFDQTADETAAAGPNSDWVIDAWGRLPAPSNPTRADDWSGALSGLGFDLYSRGHRVESLVAWQGQLTHNVADNPQDLSRYDVAVVFEPSRMLARPEQDALVAYVLAGGGLLVVANHRSADRDSNGASAPGVWNDLFDHNGVQHDPFGFRFDEVDVDVAAPLTNILAADHPVITGLETTVARLGYYTGCTARLTGTNPKATGLVALAGDDEALVVGVAEAGLGRVVFVTDSAMAGDGTDSHGNTLGDHDSWNDPAIDNRALFLNAIAWLGGS